MEEEDNQYYDMNAKQDSNPLDLPMITIDAKVSILVDETGQMVKGTVEAIHLDQTCDVVLDVENDGAIRRETNIPIYKVQMIEEAENYWSEKTLISTDEVLALDEKPVLSASEILKFERSLEEVTVDDLTDDDFHQIIDRLTLHKLYDAYKQNATGVTKLYDLTIERMHKIEDFQELSTFSSNFSFNMNEEDIEAPQFDNLLFFMKLNILLFRIYTVIAESSRSLKIVDPRISSIPHSNRNIAFPEEILEKLLLSVHEFVRQNFHEISTLSANTSSKSNVKSSPHTNKRSTKMDISHLQKNEVQFVANRFLPIVVTLLECFHFYARTTKPTGTASSLFVELCQDILQLEPLGHSMIYLLDTKHKALLQSLQQMTISFAKTLFANHEHTRNPLITLCITLLHSTYSNKNSYKPFLLHHQVHSDNNPHVTLGIITLMTCMQSVCKWTSKEKEKLDTCNENIDLDSIFKVRTNQKDILDEMMTDVHRVTGQFANELLQRCNNKETSAEQYNTISQLLQELLLAIQLPTWSVATILLEKLLVALLLQFKKLTEGNDTSNNKRDVPQINQILDLFATIAEKLKLIMLSLRPTKTENSSNSNNNNVEGNDLISSQDAADPSVDNIREEKKTDCPVDEAFLRKICEHIHYKWQSESPLWLTQVTQIEESSLDVKALKSKDESSYWETADEPNVSSKSTKAKKGSKAKKASKVVEEVEEVPAKKPLKIFPFMKLIDSFFEINKDVSQILYEIKSSYPSSNQVSKESITTEKIQQFIEEGSVNITFQCLQYLFEKTSVNPFSVERYPLVASFQSLRSQDIYYSRILKYLFEYNGGVSVRLVDSLDNNDGSTFDMILAMFISWANSTSSSQESSTVSFVNNDYDFDTIDEYREAEMKGAFQVTHTSAVISLIQKLFAPTATTDSSATSRNISADTKFLSNTSLLPRFVWDSKFMSQSFHMIHAFMIMILEKTLLSSFFQKIVDLFLFTLQDTSPLIRTKVMKCIHKLVMLDPYLLVQQTSLRSMILSIVYDRSIAVREEGVKVIGYMIAHGYHDILLPTNTSSGQSLLLELKPLLFDEGISVRKAILFIFRDILLNQPYHPEYTILCMSLLERLTHPKEEESIKEHIVSIFQQLWFTSPTSSAISILQQLMSSQQTILSRKQQVTNAFGGICKWIRSTTTVSTPSAASTANSGGNTSSRSSKASSNSMNATFELVHIKFTAFQLIDICAILPNTQWFLTLLQTLLHQSGNQGTDTSSTVKQRQEDSVQHCQKIVTFLVDLLLRVEEQTTQIEEYILQPKQLSWGEYKAQILSIVTLFTEAHPPFIVKYLLTLYPYLKQDTSLSNALNSHINGCIMKIIEVTSILDSHPLSAYSQEILEDLVKIALNQSGKNVQQAISCMCMFILHITHNAIPYFKLIEKCFLSLAMVAKMMSQQQEQLQATGQDASFQNILTPAYSARLQRCLVVLGYLCEQGKKCKSEVANTASALPSLELPLHLTAKQVLAYNEQVAQQSILTIQLVDPRTFFGACYSAIMYCITLPDPSIQLRSVQALCGVFTGYPRLMLLAQSSGFFARIFSTAFDETIQERFIVGLKDMMIVEEHRLEKQASTQQMKDSGRVKVINTRETVLGGPVDQDSDATIAGFVLQQHLPLLITCLFHRTTTLRYETLQLINTLLRQGMLCPLDILPSVIALQGDANEEIRTQSLLLLQQQDERHPGFLDNRLLDGIDHMFTFQQSVFGHVFSTFTIDPSDPEHQMIANMPILKLNPNELSSISMLSCLYATCIQNTKARKQQLFYGILRKCTNAMADVITNTTKKDASSNNNKQPPAIAHSPIRSSKTATTPTTTSSIPLTISTTDITSETTTTVTAATPLVIPKYTIHQINSRIEQLHTLFPQIAYNLSLLTSLPFPILDDVLMILHWISRNIPHETMMQLTKVKELMIQYMGAKVVNYEDVYQQNSVLGLGQSVTELLASSGTAGSGTGSGATGSSSRKKQVLEQAFPVDTILTLSYDAFALAMNGVSSQPSQDTMHSPTTTISATTITSPSTTTTTSTSTTSGHKVSMTILPPFLRHICHELYTLQYQLRCEEMLLRCKSYLKSLYNISDERCAQYDPSMTSSSNTSSTSAAAAATASNALFQEKAIAFFDAPFVPLPLSIVSMEELMSKELHDCFTGKAVHSSSTSSSSGTTRTSATGNTNTTPPKGHAKKEPPSKKKAGHKKKSLTDDDKAEEGSSAPQVITDKDTTQVAAVVAVVGEGEGDAISTVEVVYGWVQRCIEDFNRINAIVHMDGDDFKFDVSAEGHGTAAGGIVGAHKKAKRGAGGGGGVSTPSRRGGSTKGTPSSASATPRGGAGGAGGASKRGGSGGKRKRSSGHEESSDTEDYRDSDVGTIGIAVGTKGSSKRKASPVGGSSKHSTPESSGNAYERKERSAKRTMNYLFTCEEEEEEEEK